MRVTVQLRSADFAPARRNKRAVSGSATCPHTSRGATSGFAATAPAWAQPPITSTDASRFTESFSDEAFLCQDELYTITVAGHELVHFTYFEETGAVHFHEIVHAHVVAVPLDGTGPSYAGTFRVSDSENIRAVKQDDRLVEVDTDLNRVVARGSDGSRAFLKEHAHFTVDANGETSVELATTKMVCS